MQGVSELFNTTKIPQVVRVRQHFDETHILDEKLPEIVEQQLEASGIGQKLHPGMRVALTCGSRGIHGYAKMAKTIVDYLRAHGAEPFIVAAMGSHGGATEEGQRSILHDYGITEEAMGCPVHCEMETVCIGKSIKRGQPVYLDKNAAGADGIVLFNRIKPHTSYTGPYESGLVKMMAIGLGKQKGAAAIHGQSPSIMHELIEEYGKTILANAPVLGGIAVIENAYDLPYSITGLSVEQIPEEEPKLLKLAYEKFARLLFDKCDVLVVDRIGKNISGDGMDPNITGRFCTKYRTGGLQPEKLVVLGLTEQTHGNAQGMGLADVTSKRLADEMIPSMTYPTGVTNTFLHLMKLPMVMDNDREAIQLALHSCPDAEDPENPKLIRISDTAHIGEIEISTALLETAQKNPNIEVLTQPYDLPFDENGNLF